MITVCISTYGTQDWADLAATRAGRSVQEHTVIYVHQPKGTIATARNAAAKKARTEWICFLDADDELGENYVPWMETAVRQNPGGEKLFTPAVQQVRKGRAASAMFFPECDLSIGNWLVIGTLIRRQFFLDLGGFHELEHGVEDWNLWARAVRAGAEIVKVKRAVYRAYWSPGSKHRELRKDPRAYARAYHAAYQDAWG